MLLLLLLLSSATCLDSRDRNDIEANWAKLVATSEQGCQQWLGRRFPGQLAISLQRVGATRRAVAPTIMSFVCPTRRKQYEAIEAELILTLLMRGRELGFGETQLLASEPISLDHEIGSRVAELCALLGVDTSRTAAAATTTRTRTIRANLLCFVDLLCFWCPKAESVA